MRWTYFVKNIFQLVLGQSGAFNIFDCAKLLRHALAVLALDGCHFLPCKLVPNRCIFSEIDLCSYNQAGHAWAVVVHLRKPFLPNVLKGCWRGDGKADEEDIGLRIR
jgi:hypothetical protein